MSACITSLGQVQSHTRQCVFPKDTNVICSVTVGFENYADARAFPSPVANMLVFILGREDIGDGGDGLFYYDGESTATDDGGITLRANHIAASAKGRWVRIFSGPVSALWYATADGTTSDTTAVQAALNSGFDTVEFPEGTYLVGALTVPTGMRLLTGPGTLEQAAAGADVLSITSNTRLTIRGLRFSGVTGNVSASSNNAILATSCSNLIIDGCRFTGFRYNGIYLKSCTDFAVINCLGTALSQAIVRVQAGLRGSIIGNKVDAPQFDGAVTGNVAITLESTNTDSNGVVSKDIRIANNFISGYTAGQGIHMHAGQRIVISDNVVLNTGGPIAMSPFSGAGAADLLSDITITGNVCEGTPAQIAGFAAGYGIWVAGNANVTITNVSVSGNTVRYGGYSSADNNIGGIGVQYSRNVSINGNAIRDCRSIGIGLVNTNINFTIVGNVFDTILLGRTAVLWMHTDTGSSTGTIRSNKATGAVIGYQVLAANTNVLIWDDNAFSTNRFTDTENQVANGRMPYTAADTTPTVKGATAIEFANAAPVSVTNLTNGSEGQVVAMSFTDGNTTLVSGSFSLNGGINYNPAAGAAMIFIKRSATWYEISRGP